MNPFSDSTLCKGKLLTIELRGSLFSLFSSWISKTGTSSVEKYVPSYVPTPAKTPTSLLYGLFITE